MTKIERLFQKARAASQLSDFERQHHGCIIVDKRGKILAVGYNGEKTHPMQKEFNVHHRFDPETAKNSLHAEIHALARLKSEYGEHYADEIDFKKLSIFVYREHKNGALANSKPCRACMAAIRELGFGHIHYTDEDGYAHLTLN